MMRTPKLLLAGALAALSIGAVACEVENGELDPVPDPGMEDPGMEDLDGDL